MHRGHLGMEECTHVQLPETGLLMQAGDESALPSCLAKPHADPRDCNTEATFQIHWR